MTTTDSEEAEEEEVLRAITEAGNVGSIDVLHKCGFRETRQFLHKNGAWHIDLVMQRPRTA
jgi:RimJ/RimL family protein N-acetyltransferase